MAGIFFNLTGYTMSAYEKDRPNSTDDGRSRIRFTFLAFEVELEERPDNEEPRVILPDIVKVVCHDELGANGEGVCGGKEIAVDVNSGDDHVLLSDVVRRAGAFVSQHWEDQHLQPEVDFDPASIKIKPTSSPFTSEA